MKWRTAVYEGNKELQREWTAYNSGQKTLTTTNAFYGGTSVKFIEE